MGHEQSSGWMELRSIDLRNLVIVKRFHPLHDKFVDLAKTAALALLWENDFYSSSSESASK